MSAYPVAYNGSATGTGGDSLTEDLNIYYNVQRPCALVSCFYAPHKLIMAC